MTPLYFQNLTRWNGERVNGVRLPANAASAWSDAELEAVGLYRAYPPDVIPDGMRTNAAVEWDGAGVRYVLEPVPPVPWPELTQRQFWKVLALAGMHEDVMAAVDAMPLEDRIEATRATTYEHDHWLIQQFRPAFGLDDSQFRDLWFWGASL